MDKNTLTGLFLIGAILFGFSYFSQPSPEELNTETTKTEQSALAALEADSGATEEVDEYDQPVVDSIQLATNPYLAKRPINLVELRNDKLSVMLSGAGAKPVMAQLVAKKEDGSFKYLNQKKEVVTLFNEEDIHFNLPFRSIQNTFIETEKLVFDLVEHSDSTAVFRLPLQADAYLDFAYTLKKDDYRLALNISGKNLEKVLPINTSIQDIEWSLKTIQQEQSHKFEGQYSGIYYYTKGGDNDDLTSTSEDDERVSESLHWIAFKDKYFSSVLINNNGSFDDTNLEIKAMDEESGYVRDCKMNATFPFNVRKGASADFTFFFGPNDYDLLTSYDDELSDDEQLHLDHLVYLGANIFRLVNKWIIIPVITFLQGFLSNWGIIILLLTLIIKSALFPVTFKSYLSQAKMRVLKPQVDEINAKYEGKTDQETMLKKQKETMALYSSVGVSPLGGCLPMLLQSPFLIALYMYFPTSILLRGESFLWAKDLSTYDSVPFLTWNYDLPLIGDHISIFCVLMTTINIIYTKYITAQNSTSGGNEAMAMMKYFPYIMSIMFFFMFNSNASGLSYYYFISILITVLQYFGSRYLIDEEKLLAQMEENKKKPKKKSKWIERMEEAQRQQQAMQKKKR